MKRLTLSLMSAATLLIPQFSLAAPAVGSNVQYPQRLAPDARIKTYTYDPYGVYAFTGHYRYQSSIEFADGEEIQEISMGDPTGWQMVSAGNRLFMKPIDPEATTNMVIFTNKRIYFFELYAEEAEGIRDEELAFIIRFQYPTDRNDDGAFRQYAGADAGADDEPTYKEEPEKYNFSYTITGSRFIAPLKIFDDGEFTYLEFRDINADLPAIFMVNKFGDESLINYRMMGDFVVIERVASQFTLRYGDEIACVFNESDPLEKPAPPKKVLGVF